MKPNKECYSFNDSMHCPPGGFIVKYHNDGADVRLNCASVRQLFLIKKQS